MGGVLSLCQGHQQLLSQAALRGDAKTVQRLVAARGKSRASVNVKDKEGYSPLHYAAEAGHADIVRILLERGADADLATDTGFTALCLAAKGGHESIVRLMANAGGNIERADLAYGCTPLLWAVQNGGADVTRFLCEKGADTTAKSRVRDAAALRPTRSDRQSRCIVARTPNYVSRMTGRAMPVALWHTLARRPANPPTRTPSHRCSLASLRSCMLRS